MSLMFVKAENSLMFNNCKLDEADPAP